MNRSRTAFVSLSFVFAASACAAQSHTVSQVAAIGTVSPQATHTTPATKAAAARTSAAPTTTSNPAAAVRPVHDATSPTGKSTSTPTRTPVAVPMPTSPIPLTAAHPHFATPEAAMRYLAAAWNANDMVALKHVTQGEARLLLLGMRTTAVDLRLNHCELRQGGNGDYLCHFDHDYPRSVAAKDRQGKTGTAEFIAAPSASVGWYMFAYEGCG